MAAFLTSLVGLLFQSLIPVIIQLVLEAITGTAAA